MITLRAVGCTTAEYVRSSATAEPTSSAAIEEKPLYSFLLSLYSLLYSLL